MSRFPVDVKAVGLMQCRKQKKYMMFVSWSDQNNILIYRTLEEFKRLHKELKRKFPIESGSLRRSDRTIPRFKDINGKQRKSGKINRSLERLKLLETYSQELLKVDAKISQGEDVIQFFKAQTQDLDPCFPEDSVVIMPSEIGGEKKKEVQQQQPLSITYPQVSQSYRCIETFETKDTKNKTFKVAKKEIVEVLLKDMTGWWLVENADKQIAWFPASYLEQISVHKDIQDVGSSDEEGSLYFVMRAYESQKADELSLNKGVVVEVVRRSDNGWWLIRYNGRTGYMPSMCLQAYKNPHHRLQTIMGSGLHISTPNLCSSFPAPQPLQDSTARDRTSGNGSDEDVSSVRNRSQSLPRVVSTPDLESESSSLSSGSEPSSVLSWKPDLSRSLPEVEQAASPVLGQTSATHSSKSPRLTYKDRNDSGFVEPSAADLNSLADSEMPTGAPKVPTRPSAHEILQRCSTVTKRALQQSAACPPLHALHPLPSAH
ncbi:NADPH oxidase organizer 1 [Phasianus colchicus]|uniref:NADPH oxidase organizer 1 n=1 Tax=Phasianus colchicus TaxID=9054 RepID=A0A669QU37_PHACC|nr:NADPH oxidase organizer 1 [Phasianus colchicus]